MVVKGVKAGLAMKHGMGRVIRKFPPIARVTRADDEKLHGMLSKMSKQRARKNKAVNGGNGHEAPPLPSPAEAAELAGETPSTNGPDLKLKEFLRALAYDEAMPEHVRRTAFGFYLLGP